MLQRTIECKQAATHPETLLIFTAPITFLYTQQPQQPAVATFLSAPPGGLIPNRPATIHLINSSPKISSFDKPPTHSPVGHLH
jgi:hypothetical protein